MANVTVQGEVNMDPVSILAALLPAASDGVKTVFQHFFGDAKPKSVDDLIKLKDSDTQRLNALAQLDKPTGQVHTWVNDVRSMQRPVAVVIVLGGFVAHPDSQLWSSLASSAFFYLFGDRGYMYLKQSNNRG